MVIPGKVTQPVVILRHTIEGLSVNSSDHWFAGCSGVDG